MNIIWQIDPADVAKVQAFHSEYRDSAFVKMRIENNLRDNKPPVSKGKFWERMVGCLLMPCILDAAIFSSFDEGKWTEENVVW